MKAVQVLVLLGLSASQIFSTVGQTTQGFYPNAYDAAENKTTSTNPLGGVDGSSGADTVDGDRTIPWQVATNQLPIEIEIDLGAQHEVFKIAMEFLTARPAAAVLYRSNDNGASWVPFQYFSDDCQDDFNLQENTRNDGSFVQCLSQYSHATPGQVTLNIYGVTEQPETYKQAQFPSINLDNLFTFSLATNIRLRIVRVYNQGTNLQLGQIRVFGRHNCNGHGIPDSQNKCDCKHSTVGNNCEQCLPLFNGAAYSRWKADNDFECSECECNKHSDTCEFNSTIGTGVCVDCQDQTEGTQCQTCVRGAFRPANFPVDQSDSCRDCDCDLDGSTSAICSRDVLDPSEQTPGTCLCKTNVVGTKCDACKTGFFNLDGASADGCSSCDECNQDGSLADNECANGVCECKSNVGGVACDACDPGFYNLQASNAKGCTACECNEAGTTDDDSTNCAADSSGQCDCKPGWVGRQCDQCDEGFRMVDGACEACDCDAGGSSSTDCSNDGDGACQCKSGYEGLKCSKCKSEFTRAQDNTCGACSCDARGSVNNTCDRDNGICPCKQFVQGASCDLCQEGFSVLDAENPAGCSGAPSELAKPSVSDAQDQSVVIEWSEPTGYAGPIVRYELFRGEDVRIYVGSDTTFTDKSAAPGQEYVYILTARTAGGSVSSVTSFATAHAQPVGVAAASVSDVEDTTAKLVWDEPKVANGQPLSYRVILTIAASGEAVSDIARSTSRTASLSQLKYFTTYSVAILACNNAGCGSSNATTFTTKPGSPSGLDAPTANTQLGPDRLLVTWTAAESQNGVFERYMVQMQVDSTVTTVYVGSDLKVQVADLEPNTTYGFRVRSFTKTVGAPAVSDYGFATTSIDSPEQVFAPRVVKVYNRSLLVFIRPPAKPNGPIKSYTIVANGDDVVTSDKAGTFEVEDLIPFTNYDITLRVCIVQGCTTSEAAQSRTLPDAPELQPAPEFSNQGTSSLRVQWEPPARPNGVVVVYRVMRDGKQVGQVGGNAARVFDDSQLDAFTSYEYLIVAISVQGQAMGPAATATTLQSAPSGLTAPQVEAVDGGYSVNVIFPEPESFNGVLVAYVLELIKKGSSEPTVFQAGTDTSFVVQESSLEPNTQYVTKYTIINQAAATTSPTTPFTTAESAPAPFGSAPTVAAFNGSTVSIEWSYNGVLNGELTSASVLVENGAKTTVTYTAEDSDKQSFTVTKLEPNLAYTISIELCTAAGCTESPAVVQKTAGSAPGPFPEDIAATVLGSTSVEVRWQSPPSPNQPLRLFQVLRGTEVVSAINDPDELAKDEHSFADKELKPNTLYRYSVVAVNDIGRVTSNQAVVITLEGVPDGVPKPIVTAPSSTSLTAKWGLPESSNGVISNHTLLINSVSKCFTTDVQECTISNLEVFTSYRVALKSCNAVGCATSLTVIAFTGEESPTDLAAPTIVAEDARNLTVSWEIPENPRGVITTYELWVRGSLKGADSLPTEIPAEDTTATAASTTLADTTEGGGGNSTAVFDLLSENNNDISNGDGIVRAADGTLVFDGEKGINTLNFPTISSAFSLAFKFVTVPGRAGYLLAKTSPAGDRFYSLYFTSGSNRLYLFYRVKGSTTVNHVSFNTNINDGNEHQMLLSVDGKTATLIVDTEDPDSQTLKDSIDDCGEPSNDCLLYLGQRASLSADLRAFKGNMSFAKLYPSQALDKFPDDDSSQSDITTTSAPKQQPTEVYAPHYTRVYRGTALGFAVDNAVPFSTYTMYVKAFNSVGSVQSASATEKTVAAAPEGMEAPTLKHLPESESISITWSAPASPNGIVQYYTLTQTVPSELTLYNGTAAEYTVAAVDYFQAYRFQVAVTNQAGQVTSDEQEIVIPEAAPQGLAQPSVVAVGSSSVALQWSAPASINSNAIVNYTLRLNDQQVYTGNGDGTSTTVESLKPFTEYTIVLVACNRVGCVGSTPFDTTTSEFGPDGQSPPVLEPVNHGSIAVSWSPPTEPNGEIINYELHVRLVGSTEEQVAVDENTTSSLLTGLEPAQEYEFRVFSFNTQGNISSTWISGWTFPVQYDPVCEQVLATSLSISWGQPSDGTNYSLLFRTATSTEKTVFEGADASFVVAELEPYTVYRLRVSACTEAGCNTSVTGVCRTAQSIPEGQAQPVAEANDTSSFNIRWSAPIKPNGVLTKYRLVLFEPGVFPEIVDVNAQVTSLTISRDWFQPFSQYTFSLQVCTEAGCTTGIEFIGITDEGIPEGLSNPIVSIPNGSVYVEWQPPSKPNGNKIEYRVVHRLSRDQEDRRRQIEARVVYKEQQQSQMDKTAILDRVARQLDDDTAQGSSSGGEGSSGGDEDDQFGGGGDDSSSGGEGSSSGGEGSSGGDDDEPTNLPTQSPSTPPSTAPSQEEEEEEEETNLPTQSPSTPPSTSPSQSPTFTTTTTSATTTTTADLFSIVAAYIGGFIPGVYVHNLRADTYYEFRVDASNTAGTVESEWVRFKTEETAPEGVNVATVVANEGTTLSLRLKTPSTENGRLINQTVFLEDENIGTFDPTALVLVGGLSFNTEYNFVFMACTLVGCTNSSDKLLVQTSQGLPTGVATPFIHLDTITSSGVDVSWIEPVQSNGDIDKYTVLQQSMSECTSEDKFAVGMPASQEYCSYLVCGANEHRCGLQCYDSAEYTCCEGQLSASKIGFQCCGGNYSQVPNGHICCGGVSVAEDAKKTCCGGKYVQLLDSEVCCEGQVGTGNECCGDLAFGNTEASPRICCDKQVYDASRGIQCCGTDVFPIASHTCCTDASFETDASKTCCGSDYVHTNLSTCCNGTPHTFKTTIIKTASTDKCCASNLIASGLECCNGIGFDSSTSVCADRPSGASESEHCGLGTVCPLSKSTTASCDQCDFDSDTRSCHYVPAEEKELVLTDAMYDESGGEVQALGGVHRTCNLIPCNTDQESCDGVCYGDNQVCCDGELHNFDSNLQCCGTAYVKPGSRNDVCCGGKFVTREADKQCCGDSYLRVTEEQRCCDGTIGTGSSCCGAVAYTSNDTSPQICCGNKVHAHDGNTQCCGATTVSTALECCGGVETGVAHVKSLLMECCGNGYISSDTSICCEAADGHTVSYSYASPTARAQSDEICCGSNRISQGTGCCNGLPYDASVQVCADRGSAARGLCGTGTVCAGSAEDEAQCGVCNFDASSQSCTYGIDEATDANPYVCVDKQVSALETSDLKASITNLDAFSYYRFGLSATNKIGTVEGGVSQVLRTLASSPEGVQAPIQEAVSAENLNISWSAPTKANGVVQQYNVYRVDDDDSLHLVHRSTTPGYVVATFNGGPYTLITLVLEVCNVAGCTKSSESTGRTAPGVPITLGEPSAVAEAGGTALNVSWTETSPSQGPVVRYEVDINGTSKTVVDDTTVLFQNLKPFSTYVIILTSCTDGGCADSDAVVVKTGEGVPDGPLVAPQTFVYGATRIQVKWQVPAEPNGVVIEYRVYRDAAEIYKSSDVENLTLTDTDLKPNTRYTYTYSAHTTAGFTLSSPTNTNTPESAPEQFDAPTCKAISDASVSLEWVAPKQPNGVVVRYEIRREDLTEDDDVKVGLSLSSQQNNLDPATRYAYRIKACTLAGCGFSEACDVTTDEAAPLGLAEPSVTAISSTELSIQYTPPKQPNGVITAYVVSTRDAQGEVSQVYNGSETNTVVSNLLPFTRYFYRVAAFNAAGSVASGFASNVTSEAIPAQVSPVKLTQITATSVLASWVAPQQPNGVVIKYSVIDASGNASLPLYEGTSFSAALVLTPFTDYSLVLRAHTSVGFGASEAVDFVSAEAAPEGISDLIVSALGARDATLDWKAPTSSNGVLTAYTVRVRMQGGADILVYEGLNLTTNIQGLEPFVDYTFSFDACTSMGCSEEAIERSVKTLEALAQGVETPVAVVLNESALLIQWDAPSHPNGLIRRYSLYRVGTSIDDAEETRVYSGVQTSFTDTNLVPHTTYVYFYTVTNGAGDANSNQTTIQTSQSNPTNLAPPTVSIGGPDSLIISWLPPAEAHGEIVSYRVFGRVVQQQLLEPIAYYDGPLQRTEVTGLQPNTVYEFKVQAFNAKGDVTSLYARNKTCPVLPQGQAPPTFTLIPSGPNVTMQIDWAPPTQPNGVIELYQLYMDDEMIYSNTQLGFALDSLVTDNSTHTFAVASCRDGHCLDYGLSCTISSVVSSSFVATAPQGVVQPTLFVQSSSAIEVAWIAPLQSQTALLTYSLKRNGTVVYSGEELSFVDDALSSDTVYEYAVIVINQNNGTDTESPSNSARTFAGNSPTDLAAPTLDSLTESVVQVCWTEPLNVGTGVSYQFLVDDTVLRPAIQTQPDRLCGFVEELEANTEYSVRIVACFDDGSCANSDAAFATTQCGVPLPLKPVVTSANVTVQVNWELPARPQCTFTSFSLEYTDESIDSNPFIKTINVGSQVQHVLSNLNHSTLYSIRITSTNTVGSITGPWVSVLTTEGVPSVITGTSVEAIGSSEFLVSWSPPAVANGKVVTYTLFQNGTNVSSTLSTSTVVRSLAPATLYEFEVRACTKATLCSDSDALYYTTPSVAPIGVATPTLVGNESAFNFTLSWDEPTTSNGKLLDYVVEVKECWHPCNQLATIVKNVSATQTSVMITAKPSTNYSARVIASTVGGSTQSDWLADIQTPGDLTMQEALDSTVVMAAGNQAAIVIIAIFILVVGVGGLIYTYAPPSPTKLQGSDINAVSSDTFWLTEEEGVERTPRLRSFAQMPVHLKPNRRETQATYSLVNDETRLPSFVGDDQNSVLDEENPQAIPQLVRHSSLYDVPYDRRETMMSMQSMQSRRETMQSMQSIGSPPLSPTSVNGNIPYTYDESPVPEPNRRYSSVNLNGVPNSTMGQLPHLASMTDAGGRPNPNLWAQPPMSPGYLDIAPVLPQPSPYMSPQHIQPVQNAADMSIGGYIDVQGLGGLNATSGYMSINPVSGVQPLPPPTANADYEEEDTYL